MQMRDCLNATLNSVKDLYLARRAINADYGLVLVTMVYTDMLMLPLDTSLDQYADPGWLITKQLFIELGNLGIRIVLNEYLLDGIPSTHVLTPDNYNSGREMVRKVCADLSPLDQIMVIGPLLTDEEINPPTFGPWRDMLRWERMRGYVDGVQAYWYVAWTVAWTVACGVPYCTSMPDIVRYARL